MLASIDLKLFNFLFNISVENPLVGAISVATTNMSSKVFALIYAVFIIGLILKRKDSLIPFLIAPATSFVLVHIIRLVYLRPRPFVTLDIESLIYHSPSGSLPSMHSVSAFVIAMSIYHINKKAGIVVLALAALTGLSRVMVGVHYPLDIVIGAVISISISIIIFKTFPKTKKYLPSILNQPFV